MPDLGVPALPLEIWRIIPCRGGGATGEALARYDIPNRSFGIISILHSCIRPDGRHYFACEAGYISFCGCHAASGHWGEWFEMVLSKAKYAFSSLILAANVPREYFGMSGQTRMSASIQHSFSCFSTRMVQSTCFRSCFLCSTPTQDWCGRGLRGAKKASTASLPWDCFLTEISKMFINTCRLALNWMGGRHFIYFMTFRPWNLCYPFRYFETKNGARCPSMDRDSTPAMAGFPNLSEPRGKRHFLYRKDQDGSKQCTWLSLFSVMYLHESRGSDLRLRWAIRTAVLPLGLIDEQILCLSIWNVSEGRRHRDLEQAHPGAFLLFLLQDEHRSEQLRGISWRWLRFVSKELLSLCRWLYQADRTPLHDQFAWLPLVLSDESVRICATSCGKPALETCK